MCESNPAHTTGHMEEQCDWMPYLLYYKGLDNRLSAYNYIPLICLQVRCWHHRTFHSVNIVKVGPEGVQNDVFKEYTVSATYLHLNHDLVCKNASDVVANIQEKINGIFSTQIREG